VCVKGELAGEWEEQSYQTYLNHGNNYITG
jgi:hypothetical protein